MAVLLNSKAREIDAAPHRKQFRRVGISSLYDHLQARLGPVSNHGLEAAEKAGKADPRQAGADPTGKGIEIVRHLP
jgi:hypothetical protein